MDKRYQVFISSTFRDLIDERQAVLKAILEMDHMPAGMELFPAGDDSAWQLIKDVIDASDYYVLIVGGRYGSMDEAGIGFTEKEYDHAISTKKAVIPVLHSNPDNLPRDKTDTAVPTWKKLLKFREKVEKRHTCVYWANADDLKARVIVGVTAEIKRHPSPGWVRADRIPSDATVSEVLRLRNQVAELEGAVASQRSGPPPGTDDLHQGEDTYQIEVSFVAREEASGYPFHNDLRYTSNIFPTWNEIFAAIAPSLINEASDSDLRSNMKAFFATRVRDEFGGDKKLKGRTLREFAVSAAQLETCIVQLRALGLIVESIKQRSVKDTRTFWKLTHYGDTLMVQLRALRRTPAPLRGHQGSVSAKQSDAIDAA